MIMKKTSLTLALTLIPYIILCQTGHILQGVGAVNMSMGGASTAQPLDITGAMQWNPASISSFDESSLKLDVGLFFSSPELNSTVPLTTGSSFSGTTEDDRGVSPLPALAYVWASPASKHSFGVSAFGISGFGVTFPESMSNPINAPQMPGGTGGFGHIESDYMLLQVGFTYAYEINEHLSIGIEPTINVSTLELMPNPTANGNNQGLYPYTDKATAIGFGGQIGIFYDSGTGVKLGASYKSTQVFNEFEFDNTYPDDNTSTNSFQMDYPAIYSAGVGYSLTDWDFAIDFRLVDYENTEGFSETGWVIEGGMPTGAVKGFGWENISILSVGAQYSGIENIPIRLGYTYSSNPINEDVVFFNIPATAIIESAIQVGLSYKLGNKVQIDAAYHHGVSDGKTTGPMLNPAMITGDNPYGAVPGTEVSYDMNTDLFILGVSYIIGQ